jgi:hypothetical protein
MNQTITYNLEAMRTVDIRTADPSTLVDIRDVKVNSALPQRERLIDYIRQVKNPYLFKYGKIVIQSSFGDTDTTLEDTLERHFLSL